MKQQLTARKTRKTKIEKQAPAEVETWQRPRTTRPRDLASRGSRSSRTTSYKCATGSTQEQRPAK